MRLYILIIILAFCIPVASALEVQNKATTLPGTVYIIHTVHTEPKKPSDTQLQSRQIALDFSDFEPANSIDNVFSSEFRHRFVDSFGNPNTFDWQLRTDQMMCTQEEGCMALVNRMMPNQEFLDHFGLKVHAWNDSYGWHPHVMGWYNWTYAQLGETNFDRNFTPSCPDQGPYAGCQPGTAWNQIFTFNNTLYETETDIESFEKILSEFILEYDFYPLDFARGWGYENNEFSNWIEQYIPVDLAPSGQLSASFPNEHYPVENKYDWVGSTTAVYHPKANNFKLAGTSKRWIISCGTGSTDSTIGDGHLALLYAKAAQGENVIYCYYTHSYSPNMLIHSVEYLHSQIENQSGGPCSNTFSDKCLSEEYPGVKIRYTTPKEAYKAVFNRTQDNNNPVLSISKSGDTYIIKSNEPLWAPPVFAVKIKESGVEKYTLIRMEKTGLNEWKYNSSGMIILDAKVGALDESFNTVIKPILIGKKTNGCVAIRGKNDCESSQAITD